MNSDVFETKDMSLYESAEYYAIKEWENKEPSVVANVVGKIAAPLGWLVNAVIPQKAIEGVLSGFNGVAEFFTDKDDIIRDGEVKSIEELRHKDLKLSDSLANECHNWAIAIAAVEGGAAGAAGLPGIAADIPAIVTMSFRVIHKIALCYGYDSTNAVEEEKQFVYAIMSQAGSSSLEEKIAANLLLQQLGVILAKNTWKSIAAKAAANQLGKEAAIIGVKQLAKQLGVNLTKRKALQAIPVVGAVVGSGVNAEYISDIAWAARRAYQKRWLIDNEKLIIKND